MQAATHPRPRPRIRAQCPSCLNLLFMVRPDQTTDIEIKCRHCKAIVAVTFPEGPRVIHKPE